MFKLFGNDNTFLQNNEGTQSVDGVPTPPYADAGVTTPESSANSQPFIGDQQNLTNETPSSPPNPFMQSNFTGSDQGLGATVASGVDQSAPSVPLVEQSKPFWGENPTANSTNEVQGIASDLPIQSVSPDLTQPAVSSNDLGRVDLQQTAADTEVVVNGGPSVIKESDLSSQEASQSVSEINEAVVNKNENTSIGFEDFQKVSDQVGELANLVNGLMAKLQSDQSPQNTQQGSNVLQFPSQSASVAQDQSKLAS